MDYKFDPAKVLFVGMTKSATCWYRCALPALSIGADWVGMTGIVETGYVKGTFREPNLDDYDIIVLQQPYSEEGYNQILDMQKHGQKIIYEIDDYSHGVMDPKAEHMLADKWSKDRLYWTEKCMEASNLVICSTDKLSKLYSEFNETVVCLNGIDAGRYSGLEIPKRDTINLLYAAGHGHTRAWKRMAPALVNVLNEYSNTKLVTLGDPSYGAPFQKQNSERTLIIPWSFMEVYPAAMTNGDIGLAPAADDIFYTCKSDLRFLELAMVGLPGVYDPLVYLDVEDEVTGLLGRNTEEYQEQIERLIEDTELRLNIAQNARNYVLYNRTFPKAAYSWTEAFNKVIDES